MKIKLKQNNKYWHYQNIYEVDCTQKQFDYIFQYLDFDKLDKDIAYIFFNNKKIEKQFKKTYINSNWLYINQVYQKSPEGYQYLKNNWGKDVFKTSIDYPDKQELKTIVNKVINIKLIRNEKL